MTAKASQDPKWYCVRCQTKREHIAAEKLRQIDGVEVFCPRLKYRKPTSRGTIWWLEALFPGYLLARFDLTVNDRNVTYCHGVRGLVRFGSEVPDVPDTFVSELKREIQSRASDASDTLEAAPMIEIGDEVEFAHGPFRGMSGTIVSIAPAHERVKILLEFLGQPNPIDSGLSALLLPRRPKP